MRYDYQPYLVTIEKPDGNVLRTRGHPHQAFLQHARNTSLDELNLVAPFAFSV
jgi:hypothetical protein